jgi:DNA polymerase III subunit beta
MKIECVKDKLLDAVIKAEKITGKNLTLPILSSISLEANGSVVKIKSTNLDLGLEIDVPVKVVEEGNVAVSGAVLVNFLSNLSGESKITIESTENEIFLHTSKTSTKIKAQNYNDFPIIPHLSGGKNLSIGPQDFIRGLRSVSYSAAVSSMKPELSSVYVYYDGEESLVFVATDSFRLAEKKIKAKKGKEIGSILIPFKNIAEIIRVLEAAKSDVSVTLSSNQLSFEWEGYYLVSRIIDGTFPDYKQIVPKEFKTSITLLKQDLLSSLRLANVFSDNFNQVIMKIIPGEKLFELTTKNSDIGENHNTLDAVLEGEDLTVSFNYKYIMDCFQSIESDSVVLSFTGLGKPVAIRGVGDKTFLYIVMPMNK